MNDERFMNWRYRITSTRCRTIIASAFFPLVTIVCANVLSMKKAEIAVPSWNAKEAACWSFLPWMWRGSSSFVTKKDCPRKIVAEDLHVGGSKGILPLNLHGAATRQVDRISCSRISVNQVTMRLIRLHGIGASIFRFSFARHPRVVSSIERIRSICALGFPLAARGGSLRGEASCGFAPIPWPANNLPEPDPSIARSRGMRRVLLSLSLCQSPFERLRRNPRRGKNVQLPPIKYDVDISCSTTV